MKEKCLPCFCEYVDVGIQNRIPVRWSNSERIEKNFDVKPAFEVETHISLTWSWSQWPPPCWGKGWGMPGPPGKTWGAATSLDSNKRSTDLSLISRKCDLNWQLRKILKNWLEKFSTKLDSFTISSTIKRMQFAHTIYFFHFWTEESSQIEAI